MRLTCYGHSCFLVETTTARLLLDPYLNDNPRAPLKAADVRCDYILVSHGHDRRPRTRPTSVFFCAITELQTKPPRT